jgi:hypothetical protein
VLAEKGNFLCRLATSGLPTHIPDMTAVEGDLRDDYWITAVNAGLLTGLVVPLLKDNERVGIISLARKQLQPVHRVSGRRTCAPRCGIPALGCARAVAQAESPVWRQLEINRQ